MLQPYLEGVYFNLRCQLRKGDASEVYVSRCPLLQLYSQGRDSNEAKEALKSAVHLFVVTCYEHDLLDHAMKSLGLVSLPEADIEAADKSEQEYLAIKEGIEEFDIQVPIHLIARDAAACQQ